MALKSGGRHFVFSTRSQANFGQDTRSALIAFPGHPIADSGSCIDDFKPSSEDTCSAVRQPPGDSVKSECWNPAVLLSPEQHYGPWNELHDCLDVVDAQMKAWEDLKDQPLENPGNIWFTDGSRFMHEGTQKTGWAVVSKLRDFVALGAIAASCSAQWAELEAGIVSLELSKDRSLTLYTDSKYLWGVIHAHG